MKLFSSLAKSQQQQQQQQSQVDPAIAARIISKEELQKHNKTDDCWVVVHGKVYDVTHYLDEHPGGHQLLFRVGGTDCTADFEAMYHSKRARRLLDAMIVGTLEGAASPFLNPNTIQRGGGYPWNNKPPQSQPQMQPLSQSPPTKKSSSSSSSPVSSPRSPRLSDKFYPITLSSIEKLNADTSVFHFTVSSSSDSAQALLRYAPGAHVDLRMKLKIDGDKVYVLRSYTPIGADPAKKQLSLLIKRYDTGYLSDAVHKLKIGDKVDARGPIQKFDYKENAYETIAMLAAGTGITPMLQIAKESLTNPNDKTRFVLLFANKTTSDILLRKELEDTAAAFPDRFSLVHLLSRADDSWQLLKGHINAEIISKVVPPLGTQNAKVLICGPKGFVDLSVSLLKDYGYSNERVFTF